MIKWLTRMLGWSNASYGNPVSVFQVPSQAGVDVNPDSALTYSAVFAAINAISTDIASLPFMTYKRSGTGGNIEDPTHPLFDLLVTEPNPEMSAFHFEQCLIAHALSWGNGYAEIVRDPMTGDVHGFYLLDPRCVEPTRTSINRSLIYKITVLPGDNHGDKARYLLPENVIHIKGLGFDGIRGYSVVTLARQTVGLGLAQELYGASFYGNGSVTSGFITTPTGTSAESVEKFRERITEVHGGVANAHKIGILGPGYGWTPTSISPDDAAYIESKKWSVIDVARWFGMTPIRLQDYSTATYSNVEQASLDYVKNTLRPWCENIESEFMRKCLTRADRRSLFVRHDLSAYLRGDTAAQTTYYRELFNVAALSPNEIRQSEDLDRFEGGDHHYLNGSMVAVEASQAKSESEPETSPEPTEPTEAPSLTPELTNAIRGILVDSVARMIRREVEGVRRATKKPELRQAIEDFYGRHREVFREAVEPALEAYGTAIGRTLDAERLVEHATEEAQNAVGTTDDLDSLLIAWETTRAEDLVRRIDDQKH